MWNKVWGKTLRSQMIRYNILIICIIDSNFARNMTVPLMRTWIIVLKQLRWSGKKRNAM